MNRALVAARNIQRIRTTPGLEDVVAFDAQELAGQLAHARFILDDENRLAAALNRGGLFLELDECSFALRLRKVNFKRRANAGRTVHPDETAALLHDAVHRGEAQSCSLADFLGGEKRLENMRLGGIVHA